MYTHVIIVESTAGSLEIYDNDRASTQTLPKSSLAHNSQPYGNTAASPEGNSLFRHRTTTPSWAFQVPSGETQFRELWNT